ncbi:MAG TPA: OmpA family protein [Terriglobales bacterium]|nr:OmpA family protein [Terriglobales bacterium]
MKTLNLLGRSIIPSLILVGVSVIPGFAQQGKLVIHATPKQAYIFVDDHAISEASKHGKLSLSAGEHKIQLVNYGYQGETRNVTITAGKTTTLDISLTAIPGMVAKPFGAMTIEGANHDAILLNGKTPDFFVGHGDEFNNEHWWKQELVVPPGTYQVTVLHRDKELWSGPVTVAADQRVVIDVPKGVKKTVPWHRGEKIGERPRFDAESPSIASPANTMVAVAKPTAQLSASADQLNCGDASKLQWTSTDAPAVEISPVGTVATSGEQSVQPKQTTTYNLTATGPGGTATSSATVNVNTAIQANLALAPGEVRYVRLGNEVVRQSSADLNWNVSNASSVSVDPLGSVDPTGNRTLPVSPKKTDPGPVDETVTYTLTASNGCGTTETRTATLHIVGSIEEDKLSMRSVYFQTDRPRTIKSDAALLPSEKEALTSIADAFKKYLTYKPDARLILSGYADRRGTGRYNKALSDRRAILAKRFLVEQGVPEANIMTRAYGKERTLGVNEVKQLMDQDSTLTADQRKKTYKKLPTIVLAYNRRVDVTLSTTQQESARTYPFNTKDFARLVQRNAPRSKGPVELAAQREKINKKINN